MKASIATDSAGGTVVVTPQGELGLEAGPDLRSILLQACEAGVPVVVDLSQVTFIDSSTVGVLITAHRRLAAQGHTLVLVKASARITTVLRISGLLQLLDVETSSDDEDDDDGPGRC